MSDSNGHTVEMSPEIGALAEALAKAQAEMKAALRDSDNPYFKSKYADLAAVLDACRGPLTNNGLAVFQPATAHGAEVSVTTMLAHTSGQWIRCPLTTTAKDASPQAVGSCVTYLRRYGLSSMVGVAPEDDDAEAAEGRSHGPKPARRDAPRRPMEEVGRPDRPLEPVSEAEVAQAFPEDVARELEDPRPRFAAGKDMACPNCKRRVFTRKDGSGWFCWRQKGGCGMQWSRVAMPVAAPAAPEKQIDLETGEVLSPADEMALRAKLMADAKRLWGKIQLSEFDRMKFAQTYTGSTDLNVAKIKDMKEMVNTLRVRAGEPKWPAPPPEAA